MNKRIPLTMVGAAAVLCVVLSGCTAGGSSTPSPTAKTGTALDTVTVAVTPDSIVSPDPAYGYTLANEETTLGLLTYTPRISGKTGTIVPGLAESVPTPTNDGTTYTFTLREGVKYSDGTPILASDAKYAIERLFLANHYSVSKFADLAGAADFQSTRTGGISGITADDTARTVTFNLTKAMPTFTSLMALYFTAPVPSGTPVENTPNVPSTGPMMVKEFTPSDGFTLIKNPSFVATSDVAASNVNTIVAVGVSDPAVALQGTLDGTYDLDGLSIPSDSVTSVFANNKDQTVVTPLQQTYMFSMNSSKAPFNDERVRKAVNLAIDRDAMASLSGGLQLATQNVLAPGDSAYSAQSPYQYNLDQAKSLIQEAGVAGTSVTLDASTDDSSQPYAVYLEGQLRAIGLNPQLQVIPSAQYDGIPSKPSTAPDIAWYPWNELVPDASDWIGQLFDGSLINDTYTTNWSYVNDPDIDSQIASAEAMPLGTDRDTAWAALDKTIVDKSYVAPYANPLQVSVLSNKINPQCFGNFEGPIVPIVSNFCGK